MKELEAELKETLQNLRKATEELNPDGTEWKQWSQYVLKGLERLSDSYDGLRRDMENIRVDIARLNVKSGFWGAIGACIPVGIGLLVYFLAGN